MRAEMPSFVLFFVENLTFLQKFGIIYVENSRGDNMKLSKERILHINYLYSQYGSLKKVAELTGLTEFQIQHYLIKNFPEEKVDIKISDLPNFRAEDYLDNDLETICALTTAEIQNIKLLWEICDA
jgi:hypothetical protein